MGEADFNQFIWERNQIVDAADNFLREQIFRQFFNLHSPKTWRNNWRLFTQWLTLLIAQVERFVQQCCDKSWTNQKHPMLKFVYSDGKKEYEKNLQIVYVNKISANCVCLDEFVYLLDVMSSVYAKVISKNPICNFSLKVIATLYSNHSFFVFESRWVGTLEVIENSFSSYKQIWDCIMLNLENPKLLPKKFTLTLLENQKMPDIEKADSKDEISCLKWTIYNDKRKVCINSRTDTDQVNLVIYRCRNNTYLIILKWS